MLLSVITLEASIGPRLPHNGTSLPSQFRTCSFPRRATTAVELQVTIASPTKGFYHTPWKICCYLANLRPPTYTLRLRMTPLLSSSFTICATVGNLFSLSFEKTTSPSIKTSNAPVARNELKMEFVKNSPIRTLVVLRFRNGRKDGSGMPSALNKEEPPNAIARPPICRKVPSVARASAIGGGGYNSPLTESAAARAG